MQTIYLFFQKQIKWLFVNNYLCDFIACPLLIIICSKWLNAFIPKYALET